MRDMKDGFLKPLMSFMFLLSKSVSNPVNPVKKRET